jgi:AcrR family transcriptional regulator
MGAKRPEPETRRSPRQDRSRQTVDAVFEAMLQVFERHDTDDPSMQLIAERAGVSVGSVYQYFPTKQSLVNALIGFHLRRKMAALEQAIIAAKGLTPDDAAEALVEAVLQDKRDHSRIELALIRSFTRTGDLPTLTQYDEHMVDLVRGFLESLERGVRQTNLQLAAFIISNALRSAILLSVVQAPEHLTDPAFKRELVYLVRSYLRPPT